MTTITTNEIKLRSALTVWEVESKKLMETFRQKQHGTPQSESTLFTLSELNLIDELDHIWLEVIKAAGDIAT